MPRATVHRMQRLDLLTRRYVFDGVVALLATVAMLEIVLRPIAPETTLWFSLPAIAMLVVALVARRRFPFAGPTAYWLLAAAYSFVDWRVIPSVASLFVVGMAAAFLLGNLRNPVHAGIGLVVVLAGAGIIISQIPGHPAADLVFVPLDFGISWLAGFILRGSSQRAEAAVARATVAERERETEALRAVAEERTHIARELHDIVGHSLSVMTVQTSGVRRVLEPRQQREREALLAVERTGREALAEMRRVVGALRDAAEGPALTPRPSLSRVDTLVAQVREGGLPVNLEIEGEPIALPAGVDLTAYRLIQEGLTNTTKHAAARHADVRVRYDRDHVVIDVCDDGRGVDGSEPSANGSGHGLVGMRERVSIYGGELEAGPRPGGGFRLHARLPVAP